MRDDRGPPKLAVLRGLLADLPGAVVAYSGGADSAFLAFVAHQVLGDRGVAVTADSSSLPRLDLELASDFARRHGIPHRIVRTHELEDADYARNDGDRCAFCKEHLLRALLEDRDLAELGPVLLGVNVDDLSDHRPGQDAARRQGARFPLAEAGLAKVEVRELSRDLGLETWDRPGSACLASRIAYGVPVTREALQRVERSESAIRALGFHGDLRVRDQGHDLARIEVGIGDLPAILARRREVVAEVKAAGFLFVTLDLEGYRAGSHNLLLGIGRPGRHRP